MPFGMGNGFGTPMVRGVEARDDSGIYLADELQTMLPKVVEDQYQDLAVTQGLIPTTGEAGAGATSFAYKEVTGGGEMVPLDSAGDDYPRVSESGEKKTGVILPHGVGFGWDHGELLRAQRLGTPLSDRYAKRARRAYEERRETMAFVGDRKRNVKGIINNPDVPSVEFQLSGTLLPITSASTAADILSALLAFTNGMEDDTADIETAGVLLLPPTPYRHVMQTIMDATNRVTIASEYTRLTGVQIAKSMKLKNVPAADTGKAAAANFMVLYSVDSEIFEHQIPVPFQIHPVEKAGFRYVVPCYAEIGDLSMYRPKAVRTAFGF